MPGSDDLKKNRVRLKSGNKGLQSSCLALRCKRRVAYRGRGFWGVRTPPNVWVWLARKRKGTLSIDDLPALLVESSVFLLLDIYQQPQLMCSATIIIESWDREIGTTFYQLHLEKNTVDATGVASHYSSKPSCKI